VYRSAELSAEQPAHARMIVVAGMADGTVVDTVVDRPPVEAIRWSRLLVGPLQLAADMV